MMKKISTRTVFLTLGLSLLATVLSACGNSDTKTVRLNFFNSESAQVASKNMMTSLTNLNSVIPLNNFNASDRCVQKSLYAGFTFSNDPNQTFITNPANLVTIGDFTTGGGDIPLWLSATAAATAVDLIVPNGAKVDLGMVGSLVSSIPSSNGVDCPYLSGTTPNDAYPIIGHIDSVTINTSVQFNVPLWVLKATNTPSSAPCSPNLPSSACPKNNFYKFTCTNACSALSGFRIRFDFFKGANRPEHPIQLAPSSSLSAIGSSISIPHMDKYVVNLVNSVGTVVSVATYDKSLGNPNITLNAAGTAVTFTFSDY
jgi:hypothetical protein